MKNRGGKTWEIFFPLIPAHSGWCYQGVFLVANTKGKNERKGKEKKRNGYDSKTFDFCASKKVVCLSF